MLWMMSAMLLVVWLAGMVAATGPWIHIVLVMAMMAIAYSLLRYDRFDTI